LLAYDDLLSTLEPYLPRDDDLRGASLALARLQRTYDIPVEELMSGLVAGRQGQALSQRDVLEVGLITLASNLPDDAISWLVAGLRNDHSPLANRHDFYHALARAHAVVASQDIRSNNNNNK